MKFTEHRDSNINVVKHYQPGAVKINGREIHGSCYLNQQTIIEKWSCAPAASLEQHHLTPLLKLKPEVIILGTGEEQVFPAPALFAYCARHGIGLEVMNNLAACRTYNVLTTEDREVVLALIMEA